MPEKKNLPTITGVQRVQFLQVNVSTQPEPSIRSTLFRMAIQRGPRREAFPAVTAFVIFFLLVGIDMI